MFISRLWAQQLGFCDPVWKPPANLWAPQTTVQGRQSGRRVNGMSSQWVRIKLISMISLVSGALTKQTLALRGVYSAHSSCHSSPSPGSQSGRNLKRKCHTYPLTYREESVEDHLHSACLLHSKGQALPTWGMAPPIGEESSQLNTTKTTLLAGNLSLRSPLQGL